MSKTRKNKNSGSLPMTGRWTLFATILGSSMVFIDFSALNIALPAIQEDLSISGKTLFWIVNAYSLFLSSFLLVGGSLGDLYGRKKIYVSGILLFSMASLVSGIAPNKSVLITARAFQGAGGALMVPGSLAIIAAIIPSKRRGKAYGTWSTFSALTTVAGPVLGGWLAGLGMWRVIFFINIPLAITTVLILVKKVPESKDDSAKKLDIPGALTATLALSGLTYGFLEASDKGFDNLFIQISLAAGLIALGMFIFIEKRSNHPMLPLHLFKSKVFSGVNVMTLLIYGAMSAILFFLPLNLIQVQGYPEEVAGLSILPFAVFIALLSRFSGIFTDKFGARNPLIAGPVVSGTGLFLLTLPGLTAGPADYWASFFPGLLTLGIGMGIVVAPLTTTVMAVVSEKNAGIASGVNNTMARVAGLLAVAVLGAVMLITFRSELTDRVNQSSLPTNKKPVMIAGADKLAETQPPNGLSEKNQKEAQLIIKRSFIHTFDRIGYISAALAWLGAVIAMLTVKKGVLKN